MSTASLPSYIAPSLNRIPAYTAEPQAFEQRIALGDRLHPRPAGSFVKQSKSGDMVLRLSAQNENTLPVYGSGGCLEGTVELTKTDGVRSVEIKVSI